jgi:hypothetical protein
MIEAKITERRAVQLGLIIRDTSGKVLKKHFLLLFNPEESEVYSCPIRAEFMLGQNIVTTGSGIQVPVFEAKAHNNIILRGLDRQYVINMNEQRRLNEKYPGLKVGSLNRNC